MVTDPFEDFLTGWVRPRAGGIDRDLDALRGALKEMASRDLLGLRVPKEHGGRDLDNLTFRRFQEACARASGALAFLEAQHQSACALLAKSKNEELKKRLLPKLATGELTSGIAFSQLRRAGKPALLATPSEGGWTLNGTIPWVTGWGIYGRCVTASTREDGQILFVTHDLTPGDSIKASPVLELAAIEVAQTVSLELRDLKIPESDVLFTRPDDWIRKNDMLNFALQSPLALGCAQAAVDVILEEGEKKRRTAITEAGEKLQRELNRTRIAAYQAMENPKDLDRALEVRARVIEMAGRCAHGAIIAAAGRGNLSDHPAQRVYREALAFSVLAQNEMIQKASLRRLTERFQ